MMPSACDIHKSWEKYFTVVQWDQRGAGKTYRSNKRSFFDKTMNITQMDTDLLELVNFLRKKFNKEKIYILGHSWGTILGLRFAHGHSELLHAYFGVAQVIDTMENETLVYQQVLSKANEMGNKKAMRDLERIRPYPTLNQSIWQVNVVRKWSAALLNNNLKKGILANYMQRVLFSPQYSLLDIYGFFRGIIFSAVALSKELMTIDFNKVGYQYHIPIIFMHGKKDFYVSPDLAQNYLNEINAPYKSFILFDQSSHFPFSEERENFIDALKNITDSIDYPVEK